jgi:hypothetical protein
MPLRIIQRLSRAVAIVRLTRRYYRPRQIRDGCDYFINGRRFPIQGPNALSLVMECCLHDTYGLRRFKHLQTIVDIGANIGAFSLHACTRFPESTVIA